MPLVAVLIAGTLLSAAILAKFLIKTKAAPKEGEYTWDFYFRA